MSGRPDKLKCHDSTETTLWTNVVSDGQSSGGPAAMWSPPEGIVHPLEPS